MTKVQEVARGCLKRADFTWNLEVSNLSLLPFPTIPLCAERWPPDLTSGWGQRAEVTGDGRGRPLSSLGTYILPPAERGHRLTWGASNKCGPQPTPPHRGILKHTPVWELPISGKENSPRNLLKAPAGDHCLLLK